MLTGALAASSGNAKILGKDLQSQLSTIRDDLGICLQHDCLFPSMTVREHIQFFSRLKGLYSQMSYEEAEEHVDQIIKDVALFEKRHSFSKNLSGGMKRKLSVAMAFCGGSKVVLLDEPTSGMDPFSRRFTWNVIRQFRQNRCILLTTHFMDEADVLGDRIAIMAEGQLRCVGSPLFLKKHYGVGYQLTIEKQHDFVSNSSREELEELNSKLVAIVEGNVKDASLLNNVGSELSFQLPVGEAANFGPMFQGLDDNVSKGMISSYGVGITTMEEVVSYLKRADRSPARLPDHELTSFSLILPFAVFVGGPWRRSWRVQSTHEISQRWEGCCVPRRWRRVDRKEYSLKNEFGAR
jgi:ATP-binding cassette subfamily A (ABC1) protein 3